MVFLLLGGRILACAWSLILMGAVRARDIPIRGWLSRGIGTFENTPGNILA